MNKRSAMFVAAGLVVAMLVAGLAMATGVTGPSADAKTTATRRKPVVHTNVKTITVHRKAKATGSTGAVVYRSTSTAGGTTPTTTSSASYGDDSFEPGDGGGSGSSSSGTFTEPQDD